MAGLLALLSILAGAPARLEGKPLTMELAATAAGLERQLAGVWVPPAEAVRRLLDLVKQGEHRCIGLHLTAGSVWGVPPSSAAMPALCLRMLPAAEQLNCSQGLALLGGPLCPAAWGLRMQRAWHARPAA